MSRATNFLLISTDQQRADHLGCMGNSVIQTPNIDRLAAAGMRFTTGYVQNPLCMPSRATIATGLYPSSHRVWCNGVPLSTQQITLAHLLTERGYRTALIGKAHFTPFGAAASYGFREAVSTWREEDLANWTGPYYGFEHVQLAIGHGTGVRGHYRHWLEADFSDVLEIVDHDHEHAPRPTNAHQSWKSRVPAECHHSTWVAEAAIDWLRAHRREPFFLWASLPDPHHPYCPPAQYCDMYEPADVPAPVRREGELDDKPPHFKQASLEGLATEGTSVQARAGRFSEAQMREILAHTYGMISLIDLNVGRILDELDTLGLADNTVVVFTSDHGDLMGDHGLINKGPFHYEGLLRVPFIWRWPGHIPRGSVKESLVGLIDIMATFLGIAGIEPPGPAQGLSLLPVLTGEQEDVRAALLVEFLSGCRQDWNLRTIRTHDWKLTYYAGKEYGELYDLRNDPHEFTNLYHDSGYAAKRSDLLGQLTDMTILAEQRSPRRLCHA